MKYTLAVLLCWWSGLAVAQEDIQKMSPHLQVALVQRSAEPALYTLVVHNTDSLRYFLQREKLPVTIVQSYTAAPIVVVRTTAEVLQRHLLPASWLLFAEQTKRLPQEELSVSGLDLGFNKINLAHRFFPTIDGNGVTIAIKEDRFDEKDIDFAGRHAFTPGAGTRVSTHATIMATLIGGGGNSSYRGKGAAWGAQLRSSQFNHLLPDDDYEDWGISIQNHSYGVGIENYYGAEALAYDASVVEQPTLLHVFSAGNRGNEASETGNYQGLRLVANLTGTFKMAKNILTVGSLDLSGNVPVPSSKGPAYDGRVKPELVALGQDGSSGAAALTSGVSALLQQEYLEAFGVFPDAALLKAILLNSADDVGTPAPDFQSGYGNLNAWRALLTMREQRFLASSILDQKTQEFTIEIPENARNLKVTLVWTDVPAAANAAQALVNDLDMALVKDQQTWLPWVLSAAPQFDSLRSPALRKADHLNNVEQITLAQPAPGAYQIRVNGYHITTPDQTYYIAYQWDTLSKVQWNFPLQNDRMTAGETHVLTWTSALTAADAHLEYALNGGDWQLLAAQIDLQKPFWTWTPPDTSATGVLRLRVGNESFLSDTFYIAPLPDLQVGFDCENDFLLHWNALPEATGYQIYALGEQYLQPLAISQDAFIVLNKTQHSAFWYAVAPQLANGQLGSRSYAIHYGRQGVACYVKNFITTLEGDAARLQLSVGTALGLKSVTFEKFWQGNFIPIQINPTLSTNQTDWELSDQNLQPGVNRYRVRLELEDGQVIDSEPSEVYFAGQNGYYLFPNPVRIGQEAVLLSNVFDGQTVYIFDALGRECQRLPLGSEVETLSTTHLAAGLYQMVIFKDQQAVQQFKLVVTP